MKILVKLNLFALFLTWMLGTTLNAQQDPHASMYFFNPQYFNPAYCGSRGSVNIAGIGRFQWVGLDGAPLTQFLSVNMPFRSQSIGVGMHIVNDKIGARNNTSIYADFAYAIQLNKKGDRLSFGLTGGVDMQQYNLNNETIIDPADPVQTTSYFQTTPNFGLGIYYYGERHYVGLGIPRLLENRIANDPVSQATQARHFFIMGGYVHNINSMIQFKPSGMVKISPNAPLTIDLNANFLFYERFGVGAMYRLHESIGLNLFYTINQTFTIGYSYDIPVNDMRTNQFGSHEIALMLDLWSKKRPYRSPRYF